jgi:ribonucleoside-diphosphate reductase alpha chain
MTSDAAVAASLALQHGCNIDTLRQALLREENGSAAGPLGMMLDILAGEKK